MSKITENMPDRSKTMRAVLWEGKVERMTVKDVPIPRIEHPEDVVVRTIVSAICGSDLHTWRGELGSHQVPWVMGHEAVGIVIEVGAAVGTIKKGDKVVVPDFPDPGNIVVRSSQVPQQPGETFPEAPNEQIGPGIYGFGADFGNDLGGCQAEYVRVPFADDSLIKLPDTEATNELDYLMMSDIWPTAWKCLDYSGFEPGDSVAVFGAGPLGLLCAYSALLRGASFVYSIDHVQQRLTKAKSIGAVPINFTKGDPSTQILARNKDGVKRACDCAGGMIALNPKLERQPNYIMQQAVKVTSTGGGIGFIGLYLHVPPSAGAPLADTVPADIVFPMNDFMMKSLTLAGGEVEVKQLWPQLLNLLESGRAHPSFIVSDEVEIEEAPDAYERFARKKETKTVIRFPWQGF